MTAERKRYWRPETSLDLKRVSLARGGVWAAVTVGVCIGAIVLVAQIFIDRLTGQGQHILVYSDIVMGAITGIATGIGLRHYQNHIEADKARMHMVAEMNHHVRNALTAISLSVYAKNDPQLETTTREAIHRIDWALREVLATPHNGMTSGSRKPIGSESASRRSA